MKFLLNENKGKYQGEMISVEAETPQLAIEKLKEYWDVIEVINVTDQPKIYFGGKWYSMSEYDKPSITLFYVLLKRKQKMKAIKETSGIKLTEFL